MESLRHWTPIFQDIKFEQINVTSTVFSMLPMSLQSRLPPLRSIRKSVSMQTLKSNKGCSHGPSRSLSGIEVVEMTNPGQKPELDHQDAHMSLVTGDRTPPPEYLATPTIREPTPAPVEPNSGVHWRYACQGMSLMHVAQDEARQPMAGSGPDFERKAFLDGAEYILKSLPENLTTQELERLRASMPPGMFPSYTTSPGGGPAYPPGYYRPGGPGKSVLHRCVQAAVVHLFILLQLALPYVIILLRLALRTEREYKVSQNVVHASITLANAIGASGVRITGSLCNMGDGRLGQMLVDTAAWTIEGVTGGLTEGVGEGLVMVGLNAQALQQQLRVDP
ncbi:hypothetical protein B0T11DRAFT_117440 [Plectosphaerella cucumerina]|uniref:Uncharacterized protein n=1 Tax=Plectosphaerella cucumerina TaxID=40658 RepID=A0A8K0T563_9PEZI|nr:hypothetical protein B0T11DRAFT_117440 [Plectosphaerella cucumerina]